MSETERTDPNQELRQGDILRIENARGQQGSVPNLGVIINADCDLAHCKIDGVIAYLPIYRFRQYLEHFWIPIYIEGVPRGLLKHICVLCEFDAAAGADLLQWLGDAEVGDVAAKLASTLPLKGKQIADLTDKLTRLRVCIERSGEPFTKFRRLCQQDNNPEQYARKQLSEAKRGMGDGHFFISEIVGEADIGFVIRMRRIYTINADCCFTSEAARLTSSDGTEVTAARIARLAPLYQFKMAQLFAYQFSRIGLPDNITALGNLAIDAIISQLSGNVE